MVYFVVPGTGSWEGYFLVCKTPKNGDDPLVVRTFVDVEDAEEHRDELNEQVGVTLTESVPDELLNILPKIV